MAAQRRPGLDGLRLTRPGEPDVWLVFSGRRHRIASTSVYDALFSEIDRLTPMQDLEEVEIGDELVEGTCLVRADDSLTIHLLTRLDGAVRRCPVPHYESLLDFGFDETRARTAPPLLVEAIPLGEALLSAADRAARGG